MFQLQKFSILCKSCYTINMYGYYEVITQDQLALRDFYVSGGTLTLKALNEAVSLEESNCLE